MGAPCPGSFTGRCWPESRDWSTSRSGAGPVPAGAKRPGVGPPPVRRGLVHDHRRTRGTSPVAARTVSDARGVDAVRGTARTRRCARTPDDDPGGAGWPAHVYRPVGAYVDVPGLPGNAGQGDAPARRTRAARTTGGGPPASVRTGAAPLTCATAPSLATRRQPGRLDRAGRAARAGGDPALDRIRRGAVANAFAEVAGGRSKMAPGRGSPGRARARPPPCSPVRAAARGRAAESRGGVGGRGVASRGPVREHLRGLRAHGGLPRSPTGPPGVP